MSKNLTRKRVLISGGGLAGPAIAALLDRARATGLRQRGIADVDRRGRRRTEMTVEDFGGEGMISEVEILRGGLTRRLFFSKAGAIDLPEYASAAVR